MYNYQSPIEMVVRELQTQQENETIKLIQSYGITVDRDELIKALNYDRDQYNKGYRDALKAVRETLDRTLIEILDKTMFL